MNGEQSGNSNIIVSKDLNFNKIEVNKSGSSFYFYNEVMSKLPKDILQEVNMSYIYNKMTLVNKGILYITHNDNKIYNIFLNKNENDEINISKLAITEKEICNDGFIETTLELLNNNKFKITRKDTSNKLNNNIKVYISDLNMLEQYIVDRINSKTYDDYILTKKGAFNTIITLLENLENIENIDSVIDINSIYDYIGLISKKNMNPVITNNRLLISLDSENTNCKTYSIIKNNTQELIGNISINNDNDYNYTIKDQYENTNLNTSSFELLKQLLPKDNRKIYSKKNHS